MAEIDYDFRKAIARQLLSARRAELDDVNYIDFDLLKAEAAGRVPKLKIPFPAGLAPAPKPLEPKPQLSDTLPQADVVIVTWTVDENDALADVFTPGFSRSTWYRYDRFFKERYAPQIRNGAPASKNGRLGSYFPAMIGKTRVLCFKSELHLNQDGIRNFQGTDQTSLPVRDLFKQIIQETNCSHIITAGTCGGIKVEHDLGDVLVTRAAKFRCSQEFANAPFNNRTFKSDWTVPVSQFKQAETLMGRFSASLSEPIFGPPTKRHAGSVWKLDKPFFPNIIHEGGDGDNKLPPFHPILTTDYFEFGHSGNADALWAEGCGVEMGDAVLGLVCEEDLGNAPKWLVIRNLSDPQINGDITSSPRNLNMQIHWAVWYYDSYGYWTSVMSSLAAWAVVAGL